MIKFYKKVIIFFVLFFVLLKCLDSLIIHDEFLHATLNQLKDKKEKFDFIYMGNSLSRRSYNVNSIDTILNTKSINIGSEAQHFFITNAIFNDFIIDKNLHPEELLIVTISPWQFKNLKAKWWQFLQMAPLDELRHSFKLTNKFFSINDYPKVYSRFIRFHSNLSKEIIQTDTRRKLFEANKPNGFSLSIDGNLTKKQKLDRQNLKQESLNYTKSVKNSKETTLNKDEEQSIIDFISKCKEHKIKLLFITPPSIKNIHYKHEHGFFKYLEILFQKYDTNYIDLNGYFSEMNLTFDDFSDYSHLNKEGNQKITPFLLKLLLKKKLTSIKPRLKTIKKSNLKEKPSPIISDYKTWGKVNSTIKSSISDNNILVISRTSKLESSFVYTKTTSLNEVKNYSISIDVKKGDFGNFFGLRVQSKYPQRMDVVFDLNEGETVGLEKTGDFYKGNTKVVPLKDGWYRCILNLEIRAKEFKIIIGPTIKENKVTSWESKVNNRNDIYILPSSFKMNEF